MIQVLGLRDHTITDKKTGKPVTKKREVFFEKGWRFDSIQDVFNLEKLSALLEQIPLEEQYNLYFTVADCFEESGRKLREQWAIPFDIDKLDLPEHVGIRDVAVTAAHAATLALGVAYEDVLVSFSGNGVQLFILLESPITDEKYFDQARAAYGMLAKKIQAELNAKNIQGEVDSSVWSKGRLMRLPNTMNKKPNKPTRKSFVINSVGKPLSYDIVSQSGVALINRGEFIPDEVLKNYPKPDTKAVLDGCLFLKHCDENATTISEPQWYAETSIIARLDDGPRLVHERSSRHPGYSVYETDHKIDQAMYAAGPRTCADIEHRWDGCTKCPYYKKITSPIMIKGPDYIRSNDFGFRERKELKNGTITAGRVVYGDLKKQFSLEHIYKVIKDTDQVIIYKDTHWEYMNDRELKTWCMDKVSPEPSVVEMNEFVGQLKAHNVTSIAELDKAKEGYINFLNCILNIHTGKTYKHNPDFGFFDVRPFNYDSNATAPTWEKFLLDVMSGIEGKVQLLKEFAGYCISGDYPWLQKAMMLVGSGSNGKSIFVETLGEVVGANAHTTVPMQELGNAVMRYSLVNKSFNYSEETSIKAFADTSMFKNIVTGGSVPVKQLYVQPYMAKISAKLLIACNDLPVTSDVSHGFTRRLEIVTFDEKFTPGDGRFDGSIRDKLRQEIPGICNSILNAYRQCVARGSLVYVKEVRDAVDAYMEENDSVLHFFREVLVPDEKAEIKVTEAYEEYKIMCERDTIRPRTASWFGRDLARITKTHSTVRFMNNTTVRVLPGYRINKEY